MLSFKCLLFNLQYTEKQCDHEVILQGEGVAESCKILKIRKAHCSVCSVMNGHSKLEIQENVDRIKEIEGSRERVMLSSQPTFQRIGMFSAQ